MRERVKFPALLEMPLKPSEGEWVEASFRKRTSRDDWN